MASKKILSGSEEFMMFNEFWKLYQKFYEPEDNQRYWEELVREANEFHKKYVAFPMSKQMALGLIDCFEEKAKNNIG